jgi:hypothetical protein
VNLAGGAATLRGSTVTQNGTGVRYATGTLSILAGSRINANIGNGVLLDTLASTVSTIDGAQIRSNGQNGVSVARNGRVRIRRSTILANTQNGVLANGASARADLGTDGDPGGNTLGSASAPNLFVGVCNQTANTINAVNNTWSDCPPTQSAGGACAGARDFNMLLDAGSCVPAP